MLNENQKNYLQMYPEQSDFDKINDKSQLKTYESEKKGMKHWRKILLKMSSF